MNTDHILNAAAAQAVTQFLDRIDLPALPPPFEIQYAVYMLLLRMQAHLHLEWVSRPSGIPRERTVTQGTTRSALICQAAEDTAYAAAAPLVDALGVPETSQEQHALLYRLQVALENQYAHEITARLKE